MHKRYVYKDHYEPGAGTNADLIGLPRGSSLESGVEIWDFCKVELVKRGQFDTGMQSKFLG